MENNIQINKNTLLIVCILLVISFVSAITTAYLMGVRYGEETIMPIQVITPTPETVPPMQTDPANPSEPNQQTSISPEVEVGCTLEAKICPDGSSVGRMPPSCEFAPCPGQ